MTFKMNHANLVLKIMVNTKMAGKQQWENRDYHVQHNKDVENQDVKIYCTTNQFPELKFLGAQSKPNGVRGIGKHYQIRFYPKL